MAVLTPCVSLRWMLRNQGLGGFSRWAWRSIPYHIWIRSTPNGRKELMFDEQNGCDTEGYESKDSLGLPADSIHYAPVRPSRFKEAMGNVKADPANLMFVDIGCGKGRALLLAKKMGFRELVGVEYSTSLADIAKRNVWDADIHNEDAIAYKLPEKDAVVFMYNPFWRPTMDHFVEMLDRSLEAAPRKLWLVYVSPFYSHVVDRSRTLKKVAFSKECYAVYES